jgi:hypothetical protein
MNTNWFSLCPLLVIGALVSPATFHAAESGKLDEHLEPLRPFLGKTWRGHFKDSKPDKPTSDVVRWERALNGMAVRVLHSVNDGSYGGESIIVWDKEKGQISYHYFTTAGFHTTGTMTCAESKIAAVEKVIGNANGVTEVRSTYELRADGTLLSKAEYLKNGERAGSREVLYQEDAKAEVKFR